MVQTEMRLTFRTNNNYYYYYYDQLTIHNMTETRIIECDSWYEQW